MSKRVFNSALLAASLLFMGYAFLASTPAALLSNAHNTLAAVGMTASVEPNPYNTLVAQLDAKQASLDKQQAALNARDAASNTAQDRYAFYSLCVSLALFVLVALNFYFDMRRGKSFLRNPFSVDLR